MNTCVLFFTWMEFFKRTPFEVSGLIKDKIWLWKFTHSRLHRLYISIAFLIYSVFPTTYSCTKRTTHSLPRAKALVFCKFLKEFSTKYFEWAFQFTVICIRGHLHLNNMEWALFLFERQYLGSVNPMRSILLQQKEWYDLPRSWL